MDIYKIIEIACLSWVITNFEPIKPFIELKPTNWVWAFFRKMLKCSTCCGLWFGLILTHSFYDAAVCSVLATFIQNQLSYQRL